MIEVIRGDNVETFEDFQIREVCLQLAKENGFSKNQEPKAQEYMQILMMEKTLTLKKATINLKYEI